MNSTLKSLLFWMVLIVVGILIWNFSTIYQRSEAQMPFSLFLQHLDKGEVARVVITGNEITNNHAKGISLYRIDAALCPIAAQD